MDVDILKPDTGVVTIERPTQSSSKGTSSRTSGQTTPERMHYTEPVSEGEDEDEGMDLAPGELPLLPYTHSTPDPDISPFTAKDEDKRTGLSNQQVAAAVAIREKNLKERAQEAAVARDELQQAEHDADVESEGEDEEEATETTALLSSKRERRQAATAKAIVSTLDHTAQARAMSIDPLAPSSAFDETLRDRLRDDAQRRRGEGQAVEHDEEDEEDEEDGDEEQRLVRTAAQRALGEGPSNENVNGEDRVLDRSWRAPPGKRIAVPVRVEPKVYFAVERTFFVSASYRGCRGWDGSVADVYAAQKWLHFGIFIGTIATTLLNFIPADDTVGLISAWCFTGVALVAIAYSVIIFVYRAYRLRQRRAEGLYYDKYGPTMLSVLLVAALAANIGMRLREL